MSTRENTVGLSAYYAYKGITGTRLDETNSILRQTRVALDSLRQLQQESVDWEERPRTDTAARPLTTRSKGKEQRK